MLCAVLPLSIIQKGFSQSGRVVCKEDISGPAGLNDHFVLQSLWLGVLLIGISDKRCPWCGGEGWFDLIPQQGYQVYSFCKAAVSLLLGSAGWQNIKDRSLTCKMHMVHLRIQLSWSSSISAVYQIVAAVPYRGNLSPTLPPEAKLLAQ